MPRIDGKQDEYGEVVRAGFHYDIRACTHENGIWVEWWYPQDSEQPIRERLCLSQIIRHATGELRGPPEEREPDGYCFIPAWAFAGLREEMAYVEHLMKKDTP